MPQTKFIPAKIQSVVFKREKSVSLKNTRWQAYTPISMARDIIKIEIFTARTFFLLIRHITKYPIPAEKTPAKKKNAAAKSENGNVIMSKP